MNEEEDYALFSFDDFTPEERSPSQSMIRLRQDFTPEERSPSQSMIRLRQDFTPEERSRRNTPSRMTPVSLMNTPQSTYSITSINDNAIHPNMFNTPTQPSPIALSSVGKRSPTPTKKRKRSTVTQPRATRKRPPNQHPSYETSRDQLFDFINEHQRLPTFNERSKTGLLFVQWLIDQKKYIAKTGNEYRYKDLSVNPMVKQYLDTTPQSKNEHINAIKQQRIQELKTKPIHTEHSAKFLSTYKFIILQRDLFNFVDKHQRMPIITDVYANAIRKWIESIKKNIDANPKSSHNIDIYSELAQHPIVKAYLDSPPNHLPQRTVRSK
jgi:hypothetical protein